MLDYSQQIQDQATQQGSSNLQQPRSDLQPTSTNTQNQGQADPQSMGTLSQDQMNGNLHVSGVDPLPMMGQPIATHHYGWLWLLLIPAILVLAMIKLLRPTTDKSGVPAVTPEASATTDEVPRAAVAEAAPSAPTKTKPTKKSRSKKSKKNKKH